jgi:hypothetical protein
MGFYRGPNIVTNGLVLALDAGNIKSYQSGSTIWYDKSGNGFNGTLTNGPTFNSGSGGSIVFDGVDDFVSLPINSSFNTPSITFELWANLNSTAARHILMLNWQGNSFEVNSDRSVAMFNYSSGGQLGATSAASIFDWGSWTHFLGTYDDSAQTLNTYINGSLVATRASTPSTIYNVSVHKIAGTNYSLGINGKVSIARHYNKALSSTEVLQNYNATKGRYNL